MSTKKKSKQAFEAWQEDEAIAEKTRKDARIVSACWIYIKNMEYEQPLTESELRTTMNGLGEIKSLKILFTNLEEA